MHITKDILNDKLALFVAAGYPAETGWDTAIPQSMFDTLLTMGIHNICHYFVMDCKSNPWALHHTGEALFDILAARSKANEEIVAGLIDDCNWPLSDNNSPEGLVLQWINHSKPVMDEADAGFINLNFITAAWNNGYHEGRKSIVNENKKALEIRKENKGQLFEYTVSYCGGVGPDVWDAQMTVDAEDIMDAAKIAQGRVEEFFGWVTLIEQNN